MPGTYESLSTKELIEYYAAHKRGQFRIPEDKLLALEEELAARHPNSEDALTLLDLLRRKVPSRRVHISEEDELPSAQHRPGDH